GLPAKETRRQLDASGASGQAPPALAETMISIGDASSRFLSHRRRDRLIVLSHFSFCFRTKAGQLVIDSSVILDPGAAFVEPLSGFLGLAEMLACHSQEEPVRAGA